MVKKKNPWMVATWIVVGLIVLGSFTGFLILGSDKSNFVPPQVKFITLNPTCEESSYFQRTPAGDFVPLDNCVIEKVEKNGDLWCTCSRHQF